ncbi:ribosome maturation factor RimM [Propioniciclava soli]|uniref:Ribosome maturation factor RimM n=1 Tax=Propioniciclava soli TaxID=2775081 RepID=A0ABZ3CAH2_9ACTN|nr:ribosome maturation factor RimM [Propioniciclava soli]
MASEIDVLVGTVGRAHGLRGEVSVHVRTDEPERRFVPGARLRVTPPQGRASERTVREARWHSGTLLLAFEGVGDRTAAEALRGAELWVDVPADEAPMDADEFYDRQLVGLVVRDHTGAEAGRVREVLHLPAHDTLVVDTPTGQRLVPFVGALVPVVDLAAGFVQVADVGGLLTEQE